MLGWDYRDGAGNCPPGMYRVDAYHDCVPIQSPAVIQQQQLEQIATHYVDDSATTSGQSTASGSIGGAPYQMPVMQPITGASGASGGGLDSTTMLIIGAVLVIVLMKR